MLWEARVSRTVRSLAGSWAWQWLPLSAGRPQLFEMQIPLRRRAARLIDLILLMVIL